MTALIRYEAARHALQVARDIDEVKDIRDKAQAMAAYAKQANDTSLVEWATEIKVRAERRAGEMLCEMEMRKGGHEMKAPSRDQAEMLPSHDARAIPPKLSDLGITYSDSSRWQKLAAVPEAQFEEAVAAAKEVAGEVTTASLLRVANGHRTNFSGEYEWYTPATYVEIARAFLGSIDLDPASSPQAQAIVRARTYYTIEDDGLKHEWLGKVWLNPPYSQPEIEQFILKLVAEFKAGRVTEAVLLTHNHTDTAWFHAAANACARICFTKGRIKFVRYDGATGSPAQGQAFFYFGGRTAVFATAFGDVGFVR